MPGQKVILSPCGLYTNVNQLGKIPEGGMLEARNVVISKPGVLQSRRGNTPTWFSLAGWTGPTPIPGPTPLRLLNAKLRVGGDGASGWLGTATPGVLMLSSDGALYWSINGLTYQKVSPVYGQNPIQLSSPDGDRHWYGFEQNGTYYVATTHGVIAVGRPLPVEPGNVNDLRHAGYYPAGVPAGLSMEATIVAGEVGAAVRKDSQVAYRFCFGYRDENGIPHLGAPTTRAVVVNTDLAQAKNVRVKTAIPPGIIPGRHFWQLYRSLPSSSKDVDPGDDEGLIYESMVPTAAHITSASCTTDVATLGTELAHGFTIGEEVNITSDIIGEPPTPPTTFYDVKLTINDVHTIDVVYFNPGTGDVERTRYTDELDLSTFFSGDYNSDAAISVGHTYKNSITGEFFHVFTQSHGLIKLSATGVPESVIDVGFAIDNVACDEAKNIIYMIGRPKAPEYTAPYNYATNTCRYAEFNMRTGAVTYSGTKQAVPVSQGATLTQYGMSRAFMGLRRASDSPVTTVVLVYVDTNFRAHCLGATGNYGNWNEFTFNPVQRLDDTFCAPYENAYPFVSGDTYLRGDNGELVSAFLLGNLNPSTTYNNTSSAIFYISDYLYSSKFTKQYTAAPLSSNRKGFISIRCDRTSGAIVVGSTEDDWDVRVNYLDTPWTPAQDIEPSFDYLLTTNSTIGGITLFSDVPSGGDSLFVAVTYLMGYQNYRINATDKTATFWYQSAAGYPHNVACLDGTIGNVIQAGIYTIISVTENAFTIASVGEDFATVACDAFAEITSIGFLDGVVDGYIGPYLYTSMVEEGALSANYPPPIARDITLFRTYAFYANCNQPPGLQVTMLDVDSIEFDDIINIGSSSAIAATAEDVQNKRFKKYTELNSGITSVPERIRLTIESLSKVVNYNHDTFKNVILLVSSSGMGFASFYLRAVDATSNVVFRHVRDASVVSTAFSPYDVIVQSQQEQNVLYYSKSNIPDAVPLTNSIRIGQDNKPIRRVVAARDCMFVFKDDGCFILRGYGPPWQVDPYDLTLQLAVPDSAVVLENSVFALFTRGVFRVSDSNVELLSLPIQDQLERYMAGDLRSIAASVGYGAADNADRKFMLWLPEETDTEQSSKAYVYDTVTQAWTVWDQPSYHTICYNELRLIQAYKDRCYNKYTASYDLEIPCIKNEQKTLTFDDLNDGAYFGDPITALINDVREAAPTFHMECDVANRRLRFVAGEGNFDGIPVVKGDTIAYAYKSSTPYGDTRWKGVCLNDAEPGDWIAVTSDIPADWDGTNIPVNVFKGINQLVQFAPAFPGTPAASNHFSELALSFREAFWGYFELSIERPLESTDYVDSIGIIPFNGTDHFGIQNTYTKKSDPAVNGAYRTRVAQKNFLRTYVPRDQQRGTVILPGYETRVANWPVEVDGIYIVMTQGPTSFTRR